MAERKRSRADGDPTDCFLSFSAACDQERESRGGTAAGCLAGRRDGRAVPRRASAAVLGLSLASDRLMVPLLMPCLAPSATAAVLSGSLVDPASLPASPRVTDWLKLSRSVRAGRRDGRAVPRRASAAVLGLS